MKFSKTKSKYHENIFPLSFIMVLMDNTTCSYRKRGEACERELGLRGSTPCAHCRCLVEEVGALRNGLALTRVVIKGGHPTCLSFVRVVISLGPSPPYCDKPGSFARISAPCFLDSPATRIRN